MKLASAAIAAAMALHAGAGNAGTIIIQSTTSTQNSGLLDVILPQFTEDTGIVARVVAVGTGQAIRNATNGDGDVLLVHDTASEERFVLEGHGLRRQDVMYNDFVIVGPRADDAGVAGMPDVANAMRRIAETGERLYASDNELVVFTSRGDDSGTHKAELRLWDAAGIDVVPLSGTWYLETGQGMGATLNVAVGVGAYALTDRATWITFGNKQDFEVLVEGDDRLFNQYGVSAVNPARHPTVNAADAATFVDWITGPAGQAAIAGYRVDGQQMFVPNASETVSVQPD